MPSEKRHEEKARLHPRNKNRERYDLSAMISTFPLLGKVVKPNKYGDDSVDFSNPVAVKLLNKALLNHYYGIKSWDFPDENLCPPIPGRADYIHHIADVLAGSNFGTIPRDDKITCFDIGTGASCIYPILGVSEYGWNFIGSDIDPKSIASSRNIISSNPSLTDKIECRIQKKPADVFFGVIDRKEKVDLSICNPPFHTSVEAAQDGTRRKVKNLSGREVKKPQLNFAGINQELICEGGESRFIQNMIRESKIYSGNCFWFSTLVSKQSSLKKIYKSLEINKATETRTIPMGTGNKSSRIVVWTFLSKEEQKEWRESRW